ncbi:LysR family transcriptional regulator [Chitinibacter bivalviorum]|uniref:LysR family transcriptional regulator n=1 Tax=Chitinibacter bivalviorum TaxID=2739434 RepID=A0A7H9BIE3_9NEIS|nr:LysR family transcriptional regulator [Chitinibacter bivalviorum]QLG88490.1 LysR family transcriptional regulator [Chitinibacter bivalviorum]
MQALNYKHLHYFWVVAKEGGISAAARKLGMTAQTISGQVGLLEQEIGQTLFSQVGRKLELTEAGRTMLNYADRIFLLGEELQQVMERGSNVRSRLNIGIVDAIPKSIAQQLLMPLCQSTVKLVCVDGGLDELCAKLALHQLDLVLADRTVANAESLRLQSHALVYAPIMLLGTRDLVAQYQDEFPNNLNGAPLLLPTRNTALRLQLDVWFAEHQIQPDIVGEFSDSALMHTFAKTGIGFYPSPVISSKPIPSNDLISLGHLSGVVAQYHAIFSPKKILHPAIAQLLDT